MRDSLGSATISLIVSDGESVDLHYNIKLERYFSQRKHCIPLLRTRLRFDWWDDRYWWSSQRSDSDQLFLTRQLHSTILGFNSPVSMSLKSLALMSPHARMPPKRRDCTRATATTEVVCMVVAEYEDGNSRELMQRMDDFKGVYIAFFEGLRPVSQSQVTRID